MDALQHYTIPIQGLGNGIHNFDFDINETFFSLFEHSPVKNGEIKVRIEYDKRPEVTNIRFDINGTILTPCDRCLTEIHLPVSGSYPMLVKEEEDTKDDVDVIYITSSLRKLNVAQFIYEFVLLSVPIIKTYNCDDEKPRPCDDSTLDKLTSNQDTEAINPLWDKLQDFKDN